MSDYDKCIEMFCLTGKLPFKLFGALCEEAHNQIVSAFEDGLAIVNSGAQLKHIAQNEYKSDWLVFEDENIMNWDRG